MRDYCCDRAMEEVQHPVLNSLDAAPQLVNPVPQEVRFGPPKFMAHLAQPLQTKVTLVLYFHRQFVELLHERARSVFLPVEDDSGLGHSSPVYSQSCETAIYCRCSPTTASASTPRSMWNCRSATSCG